jgi:hypothetical protein
MTERIKATTASPAEVEAIRKLMELYAKSLGPNETIETVYKGGKARVTKMEGRFHAAIDIAVDEIPLEEEP